MPADNSNAFSPQDLTRTEDQNRAFPNARGQVVPAIESAPEEPQDWKTPMAEPEGGWQQEGTPLTIQARPKEVNKILNSKHVLSDVDTSDPSNARVFVANFLNSKYSEDKRGIYKDYEGKTKAYGLSGDPVADAKSILDGDTKTHESSQTRIAKDRKVIAEGLDRLEPEEPSFVGQRVRALGSGAGGSLWSGIAGFADMAKSDINKFKEVASNIIGIEAPEPEKAGRDVLGMVSEFAADVAEVSPDSFGVLPETRETLTGQLAEGGGQLIGQAAIGAASPAAGIALMAGQMEQEARKDAEETFGKKYEDFTMLEMARFEDMKGLYVLGGTALEKVGVMGTFKKLFKLNKAVSTTDLVKSFGLMKFGKEFTKGFLIEGGTEAAQGQLKEALAAHFYDSERELWTEEQFNKRMMEFAVGGLLGGGFRGGISATTDASKALSKFMDPVEGMSAVDMALAQNVVPQAEFDAYTEELYGDQTTEEGVPLQELAKKARQGDRKAAEQLVEAVTVEASRGAVEAGLTPAEAEARGKEAAEVADPVEPLVETAIDKEISTKKEELAALEEAEDSTPEDMKKYEKLDKEIQALETKRVEEIVKGKMMTPFTRGIEAEQKRVEQARLDKEDKDLEEQDQVIDLINILTPLSAGSEVRNEANLAEGGPAIIQGWKDAGFSKKEIEVKSKELMTAEGMPNTRLEDVVVRGSQKSTKTDGSPIKSIIKLFKGANPFTVVEEFAHAEYDREIAEGTVTVEQVREWRKAVEELTETPDLRGETDEDIKEWVAEQVKARIYGQRNNLSLPESFLKFLDDIISGFKQILGRAKELQDLEASGQLPTDFLEMLDRQGLIGRPAGSKVGVEGQPTEGGQTADETFSLEPTVEVESLKDKFKSTWPKLRTDEVFYNKNKGDDYTAREIADPLFESGAYKDLPVRRIPVGDIVPTQRNLTADNLDEVSDVSTDTGAFVILKDGKYQVVDGHHRLAINILSGNTPTAHVLDLDQSEPSYSLEAPEGVEVSISEESDKITLNKLIVDKDARSSGKGSEYMNTLTEYADATGKRITLTPSKDFGGSSVSRLKAFYKRFGFVENKGKNKDFEESDSMYREPTEPSYSLEPLSEQDADAEATVAAEERQSRTPERQAFIDYQRELRRTQLDNTEEEKEKLQKLLQLATDADEIEALKQAGDEKIIRVVEQKVKQIRKQAAEREDVTESVKALERLINSPEVPMEVRARMRGFGRLAERKTPQGKARWVEQMANKLEAEIDRHYRTRNVRTLRSLLRPFATEYAPNRRKLKERVGEEARADLNFAQRLLNNSEATPPEGMTDERRDELIDIFGDVGNRQSNPTRVKAALEIAGSIAKGGRTARDDFKEDRRQRNEQVGDLVREEVLNGEEAMGKSQIAAREKQRNVFKKGYNYMRSRLIRGMEGFQQQLNKMDSVKGGILEDLFLPAVYQADQNEKALNREHVERVNEDFKTVLGTDDRQAASWYKNSHELHDTDIEWIEDRAIGMEKRTISKQQGVALFMQWLDPSLRSTFSNMGINESTIEQVKEFIGEIGVSEAYYFRERYAEMGIKLNAKHMEVEGIPLDMIDGYGGRARRINSVGSRQDDMQMFSTNSAGRPTVKSGSMKERTNSTDYLIFQDAAMDFSAHAKEVNHYISHAELAKNLSAAFLNNARARNAITQKHGADFYESLKDQVEAIIEGDPKITNKTDRDWNRIRSNVTKAQLMAKPAILIKQLTSAPAFVEEIGPVAYAKAAASLTRNARKFMPMIWGSEYVKNRMSNSQFADIQQQLDQRDNTLKGLRWDDYAMMNVKWGDIGAVIAGGAPVYVHAYNEAKAAGMTNDQAQAKAEEVFGLASERAQQSSATHAKGAFLRGKGAARTWFMYLTSPLQYQRNVNTGIANLVANVFEKKAGRKSDVKKAANQALRAIVIYHVILPQIFQAVASGLVGFTDDEDYIKEQFWAKQRRAAYAGNLNAIPLAGQLITVLANLAAGTGESWDSSGSPIIDLVGEIKQDFEKAVKNGDDLSAWLELSSSAGLAAGIPVKTIKNYYDAITDISEGNTEHPFLRAGGWFKWSIFED